MRRPDTAIALVVCAAWLAGCATSAIDMAPDSPDRPWTPATTESGAIIPGEKVAAPAATYVLPANANVANVQPPPPLDRQHAYDLAELIDIAESRNPGTRTAWNAARNVALAEGIAVSTLLPRLTASVVTGRQIASGQPSVAGFGLGQNELDTKGTISVASFEWLLFDFGERTALIEAARQATVISNVAFSAAHQQVIYEVSNAFFINAAASARVSTATQSLKNAQSVGAAAEDRYRHGIGTTIEAAQARQATAQARLLQVQAQGAARDAYLKLISAIGISPLTEIRIADISGR